MAVVEQLAGAVDDRHLHAGADAGIESHRHALAGRRGQQQVVQVAAEHADRFGLGLLRAAAARVSSSSCGISLTFQVQRTVSASQASAARPLLLDAGARGDAPLGLAGADAVVVVGQRDGQPKDAFVAAAQQRQRAVRRDWSAPLRRR